MANEDFPQSLSKGNIVKIIHSVDPNLLGRHGEIVNEDPLTIHMVLELSFKPNQVEVEKLFDADAFELKKHLVAAAESLKIEIKSSDTKDEIVGKIKEHHKVEGRAKLEVEEELDEEHVEEERKVEAIRPGLARPRGGTADESVKTASSPDEEDIIKNDCVSIIATEAKGRVSDPNAGGRKPFEVRVCTDNGLQPQRFFREELERKGDENYPASVGETVCEEDGTGCPNCWPPTV